MESIDTVYQYIQEIAKKDQRGLLSPKDFNIIAPVAQMRVVNKYLAVWPDDAHIENALRPLVVSAPLTPVTSGGISTVTLPADFLKHNTVTTTGGAHVSILPNYKYVLSAKSKLKAPTVQYPIGTFYGSVLEVKPTNVGQLNMRYIRKPKSPNWDFTMINGKPVYNASQTPGSTGKVSQHFELPEELHEEVCIHILHDAGIVLEDALLIQYGLKAQQQ